MNKYIISLLFLAFKLFSIDASALPQTVPPIDPFELLNNMDPKELDKLMEDIAKMSPEELKYYEELGKQMFEASGYNLDEVGQALNDPQAAKPIAHKMPAEKPAPEKPTIKKEISEPTNKNQAYKITKIIHNLTDALSSIRQKASFEETLAAFIAPLEHQLNILSAYLNKMTFEKHLKYLEEKDFSSLKTKLTTLSETLQEIDSQLIVPEFSALQPMITRARKNQIEKATRVMKQLKTILEDSFVKNTLLTDIENLFKKYDTEALAIKKQIEDQQKKASEQTKKIPTTNTGIFPAIPKYSQSASNSHGTASPAHRYSSGNTSGGGGSGGYSSSGSSSYPQIGGSKPSGLPQPPSPTSNTGKKSSPEQKGKDSKEASDATKAKEKDVEPAEIPLTIPQQIERLQQASRALNAKIGTQKDIFLQLAEDLKANKKPQKDVIDLLNQEMHPLTQILEATKTILKESKKKDLKVENQNKRLLKDFFDSQLPEVNQVITGFKTIDPKTLTQPLTQEADEALTLIKACIKTMNDLQGAFARTL